MKYLITALFLGLLCLSQACRTKPSGPPKLKQQLYTFSGESRCDTTSNRGVNVSVSYVLLSDDEPGASTINGQLSDMAVSSVTDWLDSATVAANPGSRSDLNKAAALFAADYQNMLTEMGSLGGCWELKTTADTVFSNENVLTVKMETYAYTGGAHPNSNQSFFTFNRETGQPLNLSDMVSDTVALLGVVEKAFRKQQQLLPQYNLEERGYFLHDGRFFLPANVGLSPKGMIFYYNPYEIAAYAVGPIEVTVPYEQLNGILREGWL
ncbi:MULTISPECIES: DUF3298 and DUF4163 domain-containing protein [Spirosoma]|uniref:DUF3298 domain-containing protein n=1 Tax=Spirosoma sordidisoli TaxID=2502893 RepID=A0A4V1RWH3_9BACT|nr:MULTISPECIES: DUF3298 and DUF4163 domain-containing protein [Spirosoma]RYC70268.1 DUF3298 domain-containing protein [Spirosoma sordidisoli]